MWEFIKEQKREYKYINIYKCANQKRHLQRKKCSFWYAYTLHKKKKTKGKEKKKQRNMHFFFFNAIISRVIIKK